MINFDAIPEELKQYPQWVCWKYDERQNSKLTKVPYNPFTGFPASVMDFKQWTTFENVKLCYEQTGYYDGIGFVLTRSDPFLFIDLDDTDNEEHRQKQIEITNVFDSYSELSPSGKGLHIICKGDIASGLKRNAIEMYGHSRFMTVTGNVWKDKPIENYQVSANILYAEMKRDRLQECYINEPQIEADEVVLEKAKSALNGQKFKDLYDGNWQGYYNSQSEADFALIDILAFYTKNRQQIIRLFQTSALSKREKAKRVDYLESMLNRCFDNILPDIDISDLWEKTQKEIEKAGKITELKQSGDCDLQIERPDGLIGELADFFYAQSALPVELIAIVAAIGLMSGICGRSYNISQTGLNMYTLLLAQTGTGKESMASGIDKVMEQVCKTVPTASDFIGASEISSQTAALKYMSTQSASFVSISGEFGKFMKNASRPNAPSHTQSFLKFMLDVYNKSGITRSLKPSIFADKEKNTATIYSPNFSILAESAPEPFYAALSESMITDGLLPRFTILEYKGKRVEFNKNHERVKPSQQLIEKMANLCAYSLMLNSERKAVDVAIDEDSQTELDHFSKHCTAIINESEHDSIRHLWNRAHLKVLKLAALYAVGENYINPIITTKNIMWAKKIVLADVKTLEYKFHSGEIAGSSNELAQMKQFKDFIKEFLTTPLSIHIQQNPASLYDALKANALPYSYIFKRLGRRTAFYSDPIGIKNSILRTVSNFIEMGVLKELSKHQSKIEFDTSAKLYAITQPSYFLTE